MTHCQIAANARGSELKMTDQRIARRCAHEWWLWVNPDRQHIGAAGGQIVCSCIERAATGVYRRPEFILDIAIDSPGLAAAEIGVEQANGNLALLIRRAGTLLGWEVGGIDGVDPTTDFLVCNKRLSFSPRAAQRSVER